MHEIVDKLVIFLCCISIYLLELAHGLFIFPVILVLTLSSINSYFEDDKLHMLIFIIYSILCVFFSELLVFLPLILYDVISSKFRFIYLFGLIPIISNQGYLSNRITFITLAFIALTILLKIRTISARNLKEEYINFRDKTCELSIKLEDQNASLIVSKDYEINLATLTERNRIAREIHDNVGHILSRCLLQIGALIVINKDSTIKESLNGVKDTLSEAMDSIRKSVHDLHDDSIDLHDQIYALTKTFSFCHIKLNYDISENPDKRIKYSFISIVKEAISNIIKHSSATEVSITLNEHPGFYQLIIADNGVVEGYNIENGIGIRNIIDRVSALRGNVNINTDKGFKIFISIPKEIIK
ncbi:histidine kinase [Clostridium sp. CS001]|uniref:sensor histidine kinase n=1 Tax=Clostridium sp. CS001 TaxID=2880648 RepID=UPI001CF1C6F4|nr:histidine kinase [Clostridium sp. CS001]MCB2291322.1 histidine kinase [Clostridium sp. CS001]